MPEDFGMQSGYRHSEEIRASRTKVTPDGMVMFNATRHYLGRNFVDKPIKIYKLAEDLGGVAKISEDGSENLTHTFRIFKRETAPKRSGNEGLAMKGATQVAAFSPEQVSYPRRADETEDEYKLRVDSVLGFNFMLKLSNDLSLKDVSLHKEDIREQFVISKSAHFLSEKKMYERFLKFAERFGEEGVRTFFTAEYDDNSGEKILALAEKLGESDLDSLFHSYSNIVDSSRGIETLLRERALKNIEIDDELKERFPVEVSEAILRRSKDVLMSAYSIAVEKKKELEIRDVINSLEGLDTLLGVFRSLEDTNTQYRITKKELRGEGTNVFTAENKQTGRQYELKVFARPKSETGKQARINIELNFDTVKADEKLRQAFRHQIIRKVGGRERQSLHHSLRIGIDRDTFYDPPRVSLDLGRGPMKKDELTREGDILGRTLQLSTEIGHHNPKSFDERFAKEDVFEKIAGTFKEYLESKSY
ncbi:hypothetical protein A3I27_01075 [Candidatus Giovannonibacteria bacterium RIFCSPLOWO2_02_FULL_43_11b]|uniref:Uncharacterized protein n=1 Tax=Candidatus Giovannonibacteria bacterium RIFCSPHIGHO2_12_FULL_43_15 TaxID=1798341 RepID=A0A1F5WP60_9BACT|nr:MAG: hypothetical protein A2739_03060 [Candidatus Giovannonibacteria bacterium RIFCSPHIGHO2_01_FULL_43_100]OGF66696.1 MAG: hypothetical protein A3B97_02150 [Candidatus Giovannonibacteria bacterium RIFCSPHIGHO2_02_FULL_43_32]OGF77472.1 MAG: hypothetical protein A3F23_00645 [Candidatus Giovannonibacteria bacterium RIFCSPHIGHO2_12_FULL_43_15]OGF78843.1 MAG: hypothetical protein A3A15_00045 [Candidatus Giovannonibacteria bacterium RIFCSPLOWO2_01_FULL_43_60]OGF90417.1 MAG: hypothetical protein A3